MPSSNENNVIYLRSSEWGGGGARKKKTNFKEWRRVHLKVGARVVSA